MALKSDITYKTQLGEISPETIASMLKEVRSDIRVLQASFSDKDLPEVLKIVESGQYSVDGDITAQIDLSIAQSYVLAYRRKSEGGCQSCVHKGRQTICAQDADTGTYCRIDDPDFDRINKRVRLSGFSPKISRHYHNPCESWEPELTPKLEELL